MRTQGKHENYEVLNLIGYGLAKFDRRFIKLFGFQTKLAFYNFIVQKGIADTIGTVKNRQDLFDPFFENGRRGWWQKGEAYIHRKIFIDSLFGSLNVNAFTNIVNFYINNKSIDANATEQISPIIRSKFRQLQETGQEVELFFMNNYKNIAYFEQAELEDARTLGDGYDFQVDVSIHYYLAEVKGVRTNKGGIRLTNNEFDKAKELNVNYALVVVFNLNEIPKMNVVFDPIRNIEFNQKVTNSIQYNYHSNSISWTKSI